MEFLVKRFSKESLVCMTHVPASISRRHVLCSSRRIAHFRQQISTVLSLLSRRKMTMRDPHFASWLVPSSAAIWYQTQTAPHQDIINGVAYDFSRGYRALNSPVRFRCRISYGWAGSNKFRPGFQGYYKKHGGVHCFERKRRLEAPFSDDDTLSPFREMVHIHFSHARYRLGLHERNFTVAVSADVVMWVFINGAHWLDWRLGVYKIGTMVG